MKVKVLIVEDEVLLADEMEYTLEQAGYEVIGMARNGNEAIHLISTGDADVVLMDIKLEGELDGIETAARIQQIKNMPIIYLTDVSEQKTWEKARKTNPSAYLIKPFNVVEVDAAFQIAMRNAAEDLLVSEHSETLKIDDRVYLREGTGYIRVVPDDILYIQGARSYSEVYLVTKKITLSINLTTIKKLIPFSKLDRIHKSYIVNLDKIEGIDGNRVYINDKEIPVGNSYREEFFKRVRLI